MRTTQQHHAWLRLFPIFSACFGLVFTGTGWSEEPAAGRRTDRWYQRALVGMEVGPTGAQFGSDPRDTGYAAKFDGAEIVAACARAKSDYVVIWARDGEYAYYDSRLMPKCPGIGDRDVLREAVAKGKELNIPIIAYCVVQAGGYAYEKHPEWRIRDPSGQPMGRMCFQTGYAEFMRGVIDELCDHGIAGLHIDMLDQGFGPPHGCWCDACRRLFEAEYKAPMPAGVTWDDAWERMLEFRYNTSARLERELTDHIRRKHPGVTVDFNYHGNPPFSWEVGQRPVQHASEGDFVTGETGIWGFSALGVGLNAEFYRAATPGKRVQVAMQRGVRMYHDQTTRPLADLRWELFTLLAHGAFVTLVDKTPYDGTLDPIAYARIEQLFGEAQAKKRLFQGRPVADVGIYFSHRTRDWYAREKPGDYFLSFYGMHKALVYEHLPYGIVLDENSTLEGLRAFPVVVVPNAAILSERELAMFRAYAEQGGKLILTGLSGTLGPRGEVVEKPPLEGLVGGRFQGRLDSLDNHVEIRRGDLGTIAPAGLPGPPEASIRFLVKGPAAIWKEHGAGAEGLLFKPHRTVRQREGREGTDWPMSADAAAGPALLRRSVGQGEVVLLAASPDFATASEHAVVEARRWLCEEIRAGGRSRAKLRIDAPRYVESVILDDEEHRILRIHFLSYASPPASTPATNRPYVLPPTMEEAPRSVVRIRAERPVKEARMAGREGSAERTADGWRIVLEDVHEVVELSY
jgi:hypothetical protein